MDLMEKVSLYMINYLRIKANLDKTIVKGKYRIIRFRKIAPIITLFIRRTPQKCLSISIQT